MYDLDVEGEGDSEEDGGTSDQFAENDTLVEFIEPADVTKVQYRIVASSKLMKLIRRVYGEWGKRAGCYQPLEFKETYVGSCLVVTWKCHAGHFGGRWASQPTCAGLWAGNLQLASAIVMSGNSYTEIGFLFKIMNMMYISKMLYNQYQSLYIAPTVEEYWNGMKDESWKKRMSF